MQAQCSASPAICCGPLYCDMKALIGSRDVGSAGGRGSVEGGRRRKGSRSQEIVRVLTIWLWWKNKRTKLLL